jgi:hypothetical protein
LEYANLLLEQVLAAAAIPQLHLASLVDIYIHKEFDESSIASSLERFHAHSSQPLCFDAGCQ